MGELFQNNHHQRATSANFAVRWFEFDPCYAIIRVLAALRVLTINKPLEFIATLDASEQPWGIPADA